MSYDKRRYGGDDLVPPLEERTAPRPQMRDAPRREADTSVDAMDAARGAVPAPEFDPFKIRLGKPVDAYGEAVRELSFRMPTPDDVMRIGIPLRNVFDPATGQVSALDILADKAARYIPVLATPAVPMSSVQQMDFDDFNRCIGLVCSFFVK